MPVQCTIGYRSSLSHIPTIITALAKKCEVALTLTQEEYNLHLFIDDHDEARYEQFIEALSTELPLSIYMDEAHFDSVAEALEPTPMTGPMPAISPTIDTLRALLTPNSAHYFNPFYGLNEEYSMRLTTHEKSIEGCEYADYFKTLKQHLTAGALVGIKTLFGQRTFSTFYRPRARLLLLNVELLESLFILSTRERLALGSIERPIIPLSVQDEALKTTIGEVASVKLPDDPITILLAHTLLNDESPLPYLFYTEESENTNTTVQLSHSAPIYEMEDLELFITKNKTLIASGERAVGKHHTIDDAIPHAHTILKGVIKENHKENEKIITLYLSTYHDSEIALYTPESGFHSHITFPSLPESGEVILREIQNLNADTPRLIENFARQFPECFKALYNYKPQGDNSLEDLFTAAGIILEILEPSYQTLHQRSLKFTGSGGLQVDTKLLENGFDYRSFLQSLLSYRLAGVASDLLAFSIFDSFGDLFTNTTLELKSKLRGNAIALGGNISINPVLHSKLVKNFKLHTLLTPIELPCDLQ